MGGIVESARLVVVGTTIVTAARTNEVTLPFQRMDQRRDSRRCRRRHHRVPLRIWIRNLKWENGGLKGQESDEILVCRFVNSRGRRSGIWVELNRFKRCVEFAVCLISFVYEYAWVSPGEEETSRKGNFDQSLRVKTIVVKGVVNVPLVVGKARDVLGGGVLVEILRHKGAAVAAS